MTEQELRDYLAKRSRATERQSDTGGVTAATGGAGASTGGSVRAKYGNRKCAWRGEVFDSQHELDCYMELVARELAHAISELKRQQPWALHVHATMPNGEHYGVEVCKFIPDFQWRDHLQQLHVADAKSKITRTQVYMLKKKMFVAEYGIIVEET